MLSNGNSRPEICVNNLLKISRGEVPYERLKGVTTAHFDEPSITARQDIIEDTKWMLGIYEPRAIVDNIDMTPIDTQNGDFKLAAKLAVRGGVSS